MEKKSIMVGVKSYEEGTRLSLFDCFAKNGALLVNQAHHPELYDQLHSAARMFGNIDLVLSLTLDGKWVATRPVPSKEIECQVVPTGLS